MNERFKFRAYVQESFLSNPGIGGYDQYNKMVEVGGMFFSDGKVEYIVDVDGEEYSYEDKSLQAIMQFTGMRYYNDKEEIYEHDVVKGTVFKKGKEGRFIGVVKYSRYPTPGFYVEGVKQYEDLKESLHPLFKVIGNIYENPELVR